MKAASAYLICILSKIQLLHGAEAVLQIQIDEYSECWRIIYQY